MNSLDASANQFVNVTTLGTTTIAGKIVLVRVIVNTKGGSSNTTTLNQLLPTEGSNIIGIIDTTAQIGSIEYGIPCNNGLEIVTATGTAANLAVVYRTQP